MRNSFVLVVSLFGGLHTVAISAAEQAEVFIEKFEFIPATLNIKKGTTVTFTNKDAAEHTATAADRAWTSKNLQQGESYSYTFEQRGSVPYICGLHPYMTGKIEVIE